MRQPNNLLDKIHNEYSLHASHKRANPPRDNYESSFNNWRSLSASLGVNVPTWSTTFSGGVAICLNLFSSEVEIRSPCELYRSHSDSISNREMSGPAL